MTIGMQNGFGYYIYPLKRIETTYIANHKSLEEAKKAALALSELHRTQFNVAKIIGRVISYTKYEGE